MAKDSPILLVEDDTIDALTVKRALNEINARNELIVVKNGEEAIVFLLNSDNYIPFIILIDLNMPRMNGIEFLKQIKKYKKLIRIPVIVITTSSDERDKQLSYNFGASGYFIKPIDYKKFVDIIEKIINYWKACELPEEEVND
ncbi:response regulator [bacterium]|nr:response regulator [bacterium]